jgi:adenylate kinase
MFIAISGVPGVGKSQVAKILSRQLKAKVISITALVKAKKIPSVWDRSRKTKIISVRDAQKAVSKITSSPQFGKRAIFLIEGHIAHMLRADTIFILRCDPHALRKRLIARKWPKTKIDENVQAETLDIITSEAISRKRNVYEIDTTHKSAKQTAIVMLRILKSAAYGKKFKPGKIEWLKPQELA